MKLKSLLMLLVINSLLFTSCKDEMDDYVIVKLSPEYITITDGGETPMKVISVQPIDTSQPVYAIQIYENDSAYYYGLFDDVSKMEIALSTTKTYKFKVTAIKNGTGSGLKMDTVGGVKNFYLPYSIPLLNMFIKGGLLINIDLISCLDLNESNKNYPEVDIFYSTKTITIEKGTTNIDFSLLRMGFGIVLNVDTLTSGKLLVFIGNDTISLDNQKTSAYSIRQFEVHNSNFNTIHEDALSYSDSIMIGVKWLGTNGTIIENEQRYLFKRNYEKKININLNASSNSLNFEGWGNNTVTDIEGNSYLTVKIGNQTWMAENLRVTHYRDGSAIANVTSNSAWITLKTGAYCDYNNLSTNSATYGRMYNWYAVNDSRTIAPLGWHIPSDAEWTTFENYLIVNGYNYDGSTSGNKIAMSIASTKNWIYYSGNGFPGNNITQNNRTRFSALPAGFRHFADGGFNSQGHYAGWWSSTEFGNNYAWYRAINGYSINSYRDYTTGNKSVGLSIRCIKD